MSEYIDNLQVVMHASKSVMFIDPHIDPTQRRYRGFIDLLMEVAGLRVKPHIEVHRVCYFTTNDKRDQKDKAGWKSMFSAWGPRLKSIGATAEIFIWDDFHDRYVISDLLGITVPNGFDTTTAPNAITTWTRMGQKERDDVQREFDPSSRRHTCRHQFTVG